MARPIWQGAISFGLVHVPVTLHSLTKNFDLQFKLLDGRTKSTIRYERVNEETGEEVPWDQIVKAYQYEKNSYVILEEDDFKKAAVEASKLIEIQNFVLRAEIADQYFDKPYMLLPQARAEKGYVLLRNTLEKSGKAGIAHVIIRTREYLSAVVSHGDALLLILLRYAQELKKVDEFSLPSKEVKDYKITPTELKLAAQLVDSQTEAWNPENYHDEYRDKLMKWIELKAKRGGLTPVVTVGEPSAEVATNVIDLVELLRKSVSSPAESPRTKNQIQAKRTKRA